MKEQIISERANIIANLRQLVQSLVELNTRAKTHVSSNKADIKKLHRQVSGDYQRLAYIINDYQGVHFERLSF